MSLEQDFADIKARNLRVEAEKAWEGSFVRIGSVSLITYVSAVALLYSIGADNVLLGALMPVAGFLLSTLSLPPLRRRWIIRKMKV
jgi:hypothetical protein